MTSRKIKSAKQSNTKEAIVKRLEEITFFVDRSSGKRLAEGLSEIGLKIEKHDDHFEQNAFDIVWLEECGKRDWVVISCDKAIKKNLLERRALMKNNLAAFFFTSSELSVQQSLEIFEKSLKGIANLVLTAKRPFIARLGKEGKVEIWLNHKGEDLILLKQNKQKLKRKKPE